MQKLFILSLILSLSQHAYSGVWPKEGSALNYRIIRFSYPLASAKTANYKLEIAEGNYTTETDFERHIAQTFAVTTDKAIKEVPAFGKEYTWEVAYTAPGGKKVKSGLHHFSTMSLPKSQGCETRLEVTKKATHYTSAYLFSDGNKTLYNIAGEPVWFLPAINGVPTESLGVRDLKVSAAGTITFLANDVPYEINYEGNVLWTAPKTQTATEWGEGDFHHEFTRLSNGHYMVLGNEMAFWNRCKTGMCDSTSLTFTQTKAKPANPDLVLVPFCTVLEYDATGDIVWKWKSSGYFKQSDIFNHEGLNGYANVDAHANSFYFDEKAKKIYLSFKDISRIVAVKYPEGTILREYGERFAKGQKEQGNGLFSEQHSARISKSGALYLLNNDINHAGHLPSVMMLKVPAAKGLPLTKEWDAPCHIEPEFYTDDIIKLDRHGGSVMELPGGSILVSMCSPYWSMFIISKQKKILWAAIPQKYEAANKKWVANPSYRSSIITSRKELERVIGYGKQ